MPDFLQEAPRLPDAWQGDRVLREAVQFHLGDRLFNIAEPDLAGMGHDATAPHTLALAAQAESEPPVHIPYSTWGVRVDEIKVSPAYTELGRWGIEAGVTALPYERSEFAERARVAWAGLVMMWGPSSAMYGCPASMTDAAARTLLQHGDASDLEAVERLTTRVFDEAWTSGQWMTETAGGSDIGRTETTARRDDDGRWRLWGTKWFTSAATSETALTLARPEGAGAGSRGLALFRVDTRNEDGSLNGIFVRRLKEKLGTRPLPTAELELRGALAHPIGDPAEGGGVRRIATMLNLTRLHNALWATGLLGRGLAWARAYARVRHVAGRELALFPAHRATLTDLAIDYAASVALVMRCCELTGRAEHGVATEEELAVLRGLTPVAKLATARWAVAGTAEAMEAIGGVGYCEDSTIPALVRDAHVLPIWEGTTNVLALDLLRAEDRNGALRAVIADARRALDQVGPAAGDAVTPATSALNEIERRGTEITGHDAEAGARSLALSLAAAYACARLCVQGVWASGRGDHRTLALASAMAVRGLLVSPPSRVELAMDEEVGAPLPSAHQPL